MSTIVYLTLEEVIAIHHDQIERYGGSHGIHDFNLLLSAISRPTSSFGGEDLYPDIFTKAAVLLHSLVLNHAFVDGNKRTAAVSSARFLFINGFQLNTKDKDLVNFVLNVESKKIDIDGASTWLKSHCLHLTREM